MRIYKEESIKGYGAWAGALDFVDKLTFEEEALIESLLEDWYPEGIEETQLNDFLWFEQDQILEDWLGYTEEQIEEFWSR